MREEVRKSGLLYTPKHKIPLGVPRRRSDGSIFLRMKKPNKQEYEDLNLDTLVTMIATNASDDEEAS